MLKPLLMSSVALAAALMLAPTASAWDCAKASSDSEKAICASPEAKAADDAMGAAYTALAAKATGEQLEALKASQLSWIKMRDQNCGWQEKPEEKTACLIEMTNLRTEFLIAKPASGPGFGEGPALAPYLKSRAFGKNKCSADVAVYRFPGAASGADERELNGWVTKLIDSLESDYGSYADGDLPDGMQCEYSAGANITYASPDVIAMNVGIYMFGGGAHGNSASAAITLDRKTGKALAFSDVFDKTAEKPLIAKCTADIKTAKLERFADSGSTKAEVEKMVEEDMPNYTEALATTVTDFNNWNVFEDRAEVYFAPYAVGSYAEGDYTCTLPKADLQAAAGARSWIIP